MTPELSRRIGRACTQGAASVVERDSLIAAATAAPGGFETMSKTAQDKVRELEARRYGT